MHRWITDCVVDCAMKNETPQDGQDEAQDEQDHV